MKLIINIVLIVVQFISSYDFTVAILYSVFTHYYYSIPIPFQYSNINFCVELITYKNLRSKFSNEDDAKTSNMFFHKFIEETDTTCMWTLPIPCVVCILDSLLPSMSLIMKDLFLWLLCCWFVDGSGRIAF